MRLWRFIFITVPLGTINSTDDRSTYVIFTVFKQKGHHNMVNVMRVYIAQ